MYHVLYMMSGESKFVAAELANASQKEKEGNTLTGLLILWDLRWKMHFFS